MGSASPSAPSSGEIIDGRYRLVRELAAGGMGTVWEAQHLGLGRAVAVKLLHAQVVDVPGVVARFEREARATSQLDHPNIVRVTDVGRTADGQHYLVLELLVGHTLGDLIVEQGAFSPERAIAIVDQLLCGLAAAHERGLVHRDLKPDNVFVVRDSDGAEQAKILDFGIAALRGQDDTKLTKTGAVMGTPAYMSPEQALGQAEIDARSDLHAVGVILYELLAGRPAYSGENYLQVLHAIIAGRPRALAELRPGLPASLHAAVERAMSSQAKDRYADAQSFRAGLRGEGSPAFRLPSQLEITDLGKREAPIAAAPRPPTPTLPPAALSPSEEPALELDRAEPAAAAPPPPPKGGRGLALVLAVVAVAVAVAAVLSYRTAPKDATIELTEVPPGAQLALDGVPVEGNRLIVPISSRRRVLTVAVPHRAPRRIEFVPDRDLALPLALPKGKP